MSKLTVALAGNPNCGKTALFNKLTGLRQQVGNWPGVTVDRKSGRFNYQKQLVEVIDLPGIYSSSVIDDCAVDEQITCAFLLKDNVDIVVNVLDGSNLARSLYLTLQLLEIGVPVILAVNMMDIVNARGLTVDLAKLQQLTGCSAVPLVAKQSRGIEALKAAIIQLATATSYPRVTADRFAFSQKMSDSVNCCGSLSLPEALQQSITVLSASIMHHLNIEAKKAYWFALRLLEQDAFVIEQVGDKMVSEARCQQQLIEEKLGEEADIVIADARYRRVNQISDAVLSVAKTSAKNITQAIDRVVLNRFLGVPIFFLVMYAMFFFSINVGGAFQDFFDISTDTVFVSGLAHLLNQWHCPVWLIALLANGFGKGVNTIVTFIPVIGAMFLFLALLEDCGYMARAAFVMDRCMQALGLPGKSFVPMIVGFGCNVPAVMGTRTLSHLRDRILTVVMLPFMSCGARLAIFSVFASAFFPHTGAVVIFILYLIGILVAVLSGLVLRLTVLSGKSAPLVMELPAYHVPHFATLIAYAWRRLRGFLLRAGKYILPTCVLIGVLNSIAIDGRLLEQASPNTVLSQLGRHVTPVFAPLGLQQENWPATVGLVTGVLAKEVVVGTLNSLYSHAHRDVAATFDFWGGLKQAAMSVPHNLIALGSSFHQPLLALPGSETGREMSRSAYGVMYQQFDGRIGAFAYLLFVLLYFPCVSTMAVIRREIGVAWACFSVFWGTGLAYVLSVISYQSMTLMRHPVSSIAWLSSMVLSLLAAFLGLRYYAGLNRETSDAT